MTDSTADFSLDLLARHLRAAVLFAAKKDVRFYLNGVHVNGAKNTLEATGGHTIAIIKNACPGFSERIIIPSDKLELALKSAGKNADILTLEKRGGRYFVGGVEFEPLENRFPDLCGHFLIADADRPRLVPSPGAFQPAFLGRIQKAMEALNLRRGARCFPAPVVVLPGIHKDGNIADVLKDLAARTAFVEYDDATFAVMPLRR